MNIGNDNIFIKNISKVNSSFSSVFNKASKKSNLGKDDFLKLLLTQLKYQDPTDPVKDRDFVAQMAQFSTLEQMTNMSKSFEKLTNSFEINRELGLLGKVIEFQNDEGNIVKGKVTNIKIGDISQIMVGGKYYKFENILSVGLEE